MLNKIYNINLTFIRGFLKAKMLNDDILKDLDSLDDEEDQENISII